MNLQKRIERIEQAAQAPVHSPGAPIALITFNEREYHTPQGAHYSADDLPTLARAHSLTVVFIPSNGREVPA